MSRPARAGSDVQPFHKAACCRGTDWYRLDGVDVCKLAAALKRERVRVQCLAGPMCFAAGRWQCSRIQHNMRHSFQYRRSGNQHGCGSMPQCKLNNRCECCYPAEPFDRSKLQHNGAALHQEGQPAQLVDKLSCWVDLKHSELLAPGATRATA